MQTKNIPIGYWVKQADEFLMKGINEIHASMQMTRTEWQMNNSIHENITIDRAI